MTSLRHSRLLLLLALAPSWAVLGQDLAEPADGVLPTDILAEAAPLRLAQAAEPARQPLVSRIEISGLKLIDEAVVRDTLQLKLGQPYDASKLQQDVDAIYALGWFLFTREAGGRGSVVTRRTDADGNVEIHLVMVENPEVGEVRLQTDLPALPQALLDQRVVWLKVGRPLNTSPDRIQRALREIEKLYLQEHRLEVVASPRSADGAEWFEPLGDGRVRVVLRVDRKTGPEPPRTTPVQPPVEPTPPKPAEPPADETLIRDERMKVTRVEVRGTRHIRDEVVLETVETKPGMAWDLDRLQRDVNKLWELGWFYFGYDREALATLGYPLPAPNVGSKGDPQPDPDRKGVTVVFDMVENPVIKEVRFVGNKLIAGDKLAADLVYLKPGQVLNTNPDKLDRDRDRIERKYSAQGYLAQVTYGSPEDNLPLLTPEPDGSVIVTLRLTEMKVGTIAFVWVGKQRTRERVFRAYMRTKEGDYFNYNRIQEDLNEIRRLDLLEDIRIKEPEVSPTDPSRLNLTFEVTEKKTGSISAGGGISSRFGLVGFVDVSQGNLWGLAHSAAARVEFGGRFNFSTNYFYPLLDGNGSELSFRLYNTEDRTGATGIGAFTNRRVNFDQIRRGGAIRFSRPIIPTLRGSVQYELENVKTERRGTVLPNLPPFPFQDLGSDTTSSITVGLNHDTRDSTFDATEGMFQSGTVEYAGLGGDNHFGKYRVETRHYWPVLGGRVKSGRRDRPAWVVATRGVLGFSSGRPPFSQSFFVGGSETLRGYPEDRFFGDRMMLFNLELRRAFKNNIQAVVFFDAGRAWFQGERMDVPGDLASAVGIGLRVSTPVGPIRFDLGFGADGNRTHFSFGQPF